MLSSSVLPGDVPGVAELDVTFFAGRGFKSRACALVRPAFAAEKDGRNGRGTREQISKILPLRDVRAPRIRIGASRSSGKRGHYERHL